MVFGRRKKGNDPEQPAKGTEAEGPGEQEAAEESIGTAASAAPADKDSFRADGPFDSSEKAGGEDYLDLGALKVRPREGLQLRLEVEERTQRVIAVTLDLAGSSLQLQAFAAPKSESLWPEIRGQIAESVGSQGGEVEELEGPLGTEVVAKLPAQTPDGKRGYRVARFVGVDGPRWFLRGVIGGSAALDREKSAELEDLFRSTIVDRGSQPLPPRDLLQLRLPKDAKPQQEASAKPGLSAPERGPEITHIG
ncbi:hypothetical protein D477_015301 [Arthrobacter crystallopoietes BAB-32]|uniref:DUF3710 domain-containing protein n=1 Tax=Arthrobacter crystallopoietes BAB-32 TaxID=1246476 RepID=N1V537_9MICC|nr:DUF3710 domain-containing protein [Arthrobacter crystallopoietes]EMY33348.1 hypothetical protein D477_015301 [Arthrobacter crystallopoietes BAB-32]